MTITSLSDHIPDLNLITFYAQNRQTAFSQVSPWTKLSLLILVILFITVIKEYLPDCRTVYPCPFGLLGGGLPVRKLFAWYALPADICPFICWYPGMERTWTCDNLLYPRRNALYAH